MSSKELKSELVKEMTDHNSSIEYLHNYAIFCDRAVRIFRVIAGLAGSGGLISLVANKEEIFAKILGIVLLVIGAAVAVLNENAPYKKRKEKIDIVSPKLIEIRTWIESEYDKIKISRDTEEKKERQLLSLKSKLNKKIEFADEHWHGVKIPKDCKEILKKADLETIKYSRMKFPEYDFETEFEQT
jgi:hypothetical protein